MSAIAPSSPLNLGSIPNVGVLWWLCPDNGGDELAAEVVCGGAFPGCCGCWRPFLKTLTGKIAGESPQIDLEGSSELKLSAVTPDMPDMRRVFGGVMEFCGVLSASGVWVFVSIGVAVSIPKGLANGLIWVCLGAAGFSRKAAGG